MKKNFLEFTIAPAGYNLRKYALNRLAHLMNPYASYQSFSTKEILEAQELQKKKFIPNSKKDIFIIKSFEWTSTS